MGKVIAVCVSKNRGEPKKNVHSGYFVVEWGIKGDAHASRWRRQISLLSAEKIDAFNKQGAHVLPGTFGENLVVEGLNFAALPIGSLLRSGNVLLEITQIGKECHKHCEIYQRMGDCIMPREGVFAKVLEPGLICVGDEMSVESSVTPRPWQAVVITLSDKCFKGEREDKSGPAIAARLRASGYEVIDELLLNDERDLLKTTLIRLCDQCQPDLILTTGGTGFSSRDNAPEATLAVAERMAPGIAESIRSASLAITPRAMLSRGMSVIRAKTLIINLPGSPKACMESMDVFLEVIPHALGLLRGEVADCAFL
ncbi:MAG: molybdopterin-binding protein [Clostridiales bacterium]|nr:molybdopterin-binding protein [Clostridiales bacterium]